MQYDDAERLKSLQDRLGNLTTWPLSKLMKTCGAAWANVEDAARIPGRNSNTGHGR
jgi:hypothetical protein